MTSTPNPSPSSRESVRSVPGTLASLYARLETILAAVQRFTLPFLRVSLGIVYIWFGALKLTDSTPVGQLVAKTVPFLPEHIFVPVLGAIEVIIGLALIAGRFLDLVALVMVGHLAGTFLVLIELPGESFQHGNPLLLTMTGEFVAKNIVLISAGLVLATRARARGRHREPVVAEVVEVPVLPVVEPAPQYADGY
jgi:uncharacterized membrane protein YkgB